MYNPKQAQQDFLNIKIAILVMVISIALYVLSTVLASGTKFILLKQFGVETTAQVTRISHKDFGETFDLNSNNSLGFYNDIVLYVKFKDKELNEINASVFASYKQVEIKSQENKRPKFKYINPYNIHEQFQIIYNRNDPSVFLPLDQFPKFKTDRNIMLGSIFLILICSILLFLQVKNYQKFRRKAQYY